MSKENITNKQPLIRYVNRQQMSWRSVDVSEDHPARAIWTLVGRLDLSPFYGAIESSVEEGGRPAFDPQLLSCGARRKRVGGGIPQENGY